MAAESTGVIRSNSLTIYIALASNGNITGSDTLDATKNWDLIANSTSGEISLTRNAIEVTDKGSKGKEHLLDFMDWSLSCEGQVRYDGTSSGTIRNADSLQQLFLNKTKLAVAWTTGAKDGSDADPIFFGYVFITEYSESAGWNDVATFSLTLTGDGDLFAADVPDATKFLDPTA